MNHQSELRRSGWQSALAIVPTAFLLISMAPGSLVNHSMQTLRADEPDKKDAPTRKTEYPQIVTTVPESGSTDVGIDLKEIKVTFDRKMQKGMSWTGGPPLFPPTIQGQKAFWLNDHTCVLPVKLESGTFYRLGFNSKGFQNFKSQDGIPLPPGSLFFATTGATKEVAERVRTPKIVKLEPANGADNVDPSTKQLSITFDIPMGEGMSWTGGGESFPKLVPGKAASWSPDKLTCSLPVELEPNHEYRLGANSLSHNNFQSEWGVQLIPVEYTFKTAK